MRYEDQGGHRSELCPHERGRWESVPPTQHGYYWIQTKGGLPFIAWLNSLGTWIFPAIDYREAPGGRTYGVAELKTGAELAYEGYSFWSQKIVEPP